MEHRRLLRRLLTILLVAGVCLIGLVILFVPIIPRRSITISAMRETAQRIEMYVVRGQHGLPSDLADLPKRENYANRITDGWKRLLRYEPGPEGTFTLTSLGRDGLAGGTGDDADVVLRFRIVRGQVEDLP